MTPRERREVLRRLATTYRDDPTPMRLQGNDVLDLLDALDARDELLRQAADAIDAERNAYGWGEDGGSAVADLTARIRAALDGKENGNG